MPKESEPPTHGRRKRGPRLTDWRPKYLSKLVEYAGNRTKAATNTPVHYSTVWDERKRNPAFAAEEKRIEDIGCDFVEGEIHRRAYEGVPVYALNKLGKPVLVRMEYSDTLLLRYIETKRPHWRPKSALDVSSTQTFATKAERDKALAEARQNASQPLD